MLNKVILMGNLGADPETRFTQDGTCVCNLRMATTEKFKNKAGEQVEKTEWHRVVMWGRLGEIANQYLSKGSKIYIEGKIETQKYQDKDGNDKYSTNIRAHEMKMLGGGESQNGQGSQQSNQSRNPPQGQQGGNQQSSTQRQQNSNGNFPAQGGYQQPYSQRQENGQQPQQQAQGYQQQGGQQQQRSNDPFAGGNAQMDESDIPF